MRSFFGGEPKSGQPHPHESGGFVWPAELGYGLFEHRGGYLAGIGVGDEDEGGEFPIGVVQAHPTPPVGHRVRGVADGTHHFNPGYGAIGPGEIIV